MVVQQYRWWFTEDEWIRYSLIAAPLMIVFTLALSTIRACHKSSYIYKPPCDRGLSGSLYGLTTTHAILCTEKDPMLGGEEEQGRRAVGEWKPRVRFDRGGEEYVIYETDSSVIGSLREEVPEQGDTSKLSGATDAGRPLRYGASATI
ncbi:hypothetical protein Q5P01_010556 [Channa striata]|uniref:Uncharacterized protein n=1 Tax=Channa striata TaxID=64152 RepID=A0AA88SYG8_CHASR|nr:hypothetical protein Q5P01_010556 [Channa striata]